MFAWLMYRRVIDPKMAIWGIPFVGLLIMYLLGDQIAWCIGEVGDMLYQLKMMLPESWKVVSETPLENGRILVEHTILNNVMGSLSRWCHHIGRNGLSKSFVLLYFFLELGLYFLLIFRAQYRAQKRLREEG